MGRQDPRQTDPVCSDTESLLLPRPRATTESTRGMSLHECTAEESELKEDPPPAMEEQRPEIGQILEARYRYRLVRRLGKGGFGSVFLAQCLDSSPSDEESPPSQVALKVLGSTRDPQARNSLKRELAALLAIKHDRIPKLYDWRISDGAAFVALEYFPSGSLSDTWSFMRRFNEEQTWRLITDVLSALNAAHKASILHLDVKPSNVLLDGNGGYMLTDFGVSHASRMSKGLLHQGQIAIGLGTHGYRAPEQDSVTIQSFDLRTDLWGVGATAWAMYTGIDLNKRQDVLRRMETGNIFGLQRLSDVALRCPPPLEEVIMGMLYIEPAERPGGTMEVLAQVRAIASGFGLDSQTVAASRRENASPTEIRELIDSLVDPLWASICRSPGFDRCFVKFEDGELLSGRGERAHHTLLLLRGRIRIEKDGRVLDVESREGDLMGAISTLTGAERTVTLRADGPVWTCIFNEAELEQLVTCNPSVAVRMIRSLANRIATGPPRHAD
jgi:serine/threonine protein kinase